MGVMACDRTDCERIMCNTCINGEYYICNECEDEFKNYLKKKGITSSSKRELMEELHIFMKTPKTYNGYGGNDIIDIDEFFNNSRL